MTDMKEKIRNNKQFNSNHRLKVELLFNRSNLLFKIINSQVLSKTRQQYFSMFDAFLFMLIIIYT